MNKIILSLCLLLVIIGVLFSTKMLADINKNIAGAKEAARAANVKIVKIAAPGCTDCFNADNAITDFKKLNVKVEEEKTLTFDSAEGSALIKKLLISKFPAYIVTGEVTKNNIKGFIKENGEIRNNTFVFTKVVPVFIDSQTGQKIGLVTATVLTDPFCTECVDPKLTVESFKKAGVKITDQKEITWNSQEGRQIISQYKIIKLPTFLLSSDIDFYANVKSSWDKIGTIEQDKTYVARNLLLPYRDLEENKILGLVDLIYLTDSSCLDCYNAQEIQKPILKQGYGIGIRSDRFVDILSTEGRNLVNKYNITKVPTILLSPEADLYTNLKNIWKNVGTVEDDGWYVFREMQQLRGSIYKNLETNEVIGRVK